MKIQLKEVKNNFPDVFQVTWVINNICSNKCSYCVPSLHSGTNHGYEWDDVKKFFDELFKRHPKIHVSISGGEPTMSPFLIDLCKMIHDKGSTVGLTSNGTKNVEYYKELSKYTNYIVFSYHPEYGDRNDVLNKIRACVTNCYSALRIMMHPKYWDNAVDFYNKCAQSDINKQFTLECVRIVDWEQTDRTSLDYTEEQSEMLNNYTYKTIHCSEPTHNRESAKIGATFIHEEIEGEEPHEMMSANEYVNGGHTNFIGWQCSMGLEHLFIFSDGYIKRGNCRDFYIGNLRDIDNIQWPTEPVICPWKICACTTDVMLSKQKYY